MACKNIHFLNLIVFLQVILYFRKRSIRPLAKINIQSKIKDMKYEKIANYSESKFRRITGVKRSTLKKW